jgi:hypothetical protein
MKERAFTGAGGAAQTQEIAAGQLKINATQHFQLALAELITFVQTGGAQQQVIHSATLRLA